MLVLSKDTTLKKVQRFFAVKIHLLVTKIVPEIEFGREQQEKCKTHRMFQVSLENAIINENIGKSVRLQGTAAVEVRKAHSVTPCEAVVRAESENLSIHQ